MKPDRMQTVANRLQLSQNAPSFSVQDLQRLTREAAESASIIASDLPAAHVAEQVYQAIEPEAFTAIARALMLRHFTTAVRAIRAEKRRENRRRLPGFEGLPLWITTEDGRRIHIEDAIYTEIRYHYRQLRQRERARTGSNARLMEFERLMTEMRERQDRHKGAVTARLIISMEG